MFLEKLKTIRQRIPGSVALTLVDRDGIPVETTSSDPSLDLEALAAELVIQVRSMTENHRELAAGDVRQLGVATQNATLLVSSLTQEYYLVLVLGKEGTYGQARFELRRATLLLDPEL